MKHLICILIQSLYRREYPFSYLQYFSALLALLQHRRSKHRQASTSSAAAKTTKPERERYRWKELNWS